MTKKPLGPVVVAQLKEAESPGEPQTELRSPLRYIGMCTDTGYSRVEDMTTGVMYLLAGRVFNELQEVKR